MGVFEIIGELCTIDSCLLKGWRYLFSASYREQVHQYWRAKGFFRSAPRIFYALFFMVGEVLLVLYLIRAVVSGSRDE